MKKGKYWILFAVVLVIFAIATLNFMYVERKPFETAFLDSLCTALYVDCSGSASISTKVVHVLLGLTTIALVVLLVSEGVDYLVKNALEGRGMKKTLEAMKGHVIVCGYGELGKTVCETLAAEGREFVVIDFNPKIVQNLSDNGVPCVEGDALNKKVLERAGVRKANRLVSALNSDSANVFLTLTAKELTPQIAVATRAYSEDAVGKLHRAGADVIVMPEIIGGLELAKEILGLEKNFGKKLVSKRT